jgi:hypothetical protein
VHFHRYVIYQGNWIIKRICSEQGRCSFARSWTTDLKDRDIRFDTICQGYTEPSAFETLDWTKEQFEAVKAGITKTIPLDGIIRQRQDPL